MNNGVAAIVKDGWANILTGLGMKNQDKRLGAEASWDKMDEADSERMYAGSDIAAKIVDTLPEDAMREGYDLKGLDSDEIKKLTAEKIRLNVDAKIEETWKLARCYGGAGLLIIADDTDDLSVPLNLTRVNRIHALIPVTRYEIVYTGSIESDLKNPNFGRPKTYNFTPRSGTIGNSGQQIHHTRILRFDGVPLPPRLFVQNNYWGDSVLNRPKNAIRSYETSFDAAALALQDFRVGVFTLKGLTNLVSNGKDDLVVKRLSIINQAKSVARAIVIDEGEKWEEKTTTFTGIPEILAKMERRLQSAADHLPHTKLFGDSPSGMGGTGRHEEVNWYDYVSARQENYLKPRLMALLAIIAGQRQVGLTLPQGFQLVFRPLWQMDEKEISEIRAKQSETDQRYIDMGVLDPEEVRDSRFGGDAYSIDTTIEETPALPTPSSDPAQPAQAGSVPGEVQKQALNGAQLTSLVAVVEKAAQNLIPRESAVEIILKAFPYLSKAEAEAVLGSVGKGFTPAQPPKAEAL